MFGCGKFNTNGWCYWLRVFGLSIAFRPEHMVLAFNVRNNVLNIGPFRRRPGDPNWKKFSFVKLY